MGSLARSTTENQDTTEDQPFQVIPNWSSRSYITFVCRQQFSFSSDATSSGTSPFPNGACGDGRCTEVSRRCMTSISYEPFGPLFRIRLGSRRPLASATGSAKFELAFIRLNIHECTNSSSLVLVARYVFSIHGGSSPWTFKSGRRANQLRDSLGHRNYRKPRSI